MKIIHIKRPPRLTLPTPEEFIAAFVKDHAQNPASLPPSLRSFVQTYYDKSTLIEQSRKP